MDFSRFIQYIASGTAYTFGVTLIALPSGLLIGLVLAFAAVYGGKLAGKVLDLLSTILRGIPPIVLLFILYFVMSGTINLSPFWAGSISLGIISSAYQMEIFRGAILSVSGEQMMASRAIGMSKMQAIRYVGLSQMIRLAIPSWSN